MALSTLYGVIMAGGRGTRFWPVSRERLPIDDVRSTAGYRSFALSRVIRRMILQQA